VDTEYHPVIVVGAGIAGLTAAWQLKKSGIQALVLESDQTVGGRMKSIQIDDAVVDCGAQFLSSAYTIIPELIRETRLSDNFMRTSPWVGLINNKNVSIIDPQKSWHLITQRVLSVLDFAYLVFGQLTFFKFKHKLSNLNDITLWTNYDNQYADQWIAKNFGKNIGTKLTSAIFNGFYFQSLNQSSASLAASVLSFQIFHPKTMSLTTGMGSLPQKLAENLYVKTGASVLNISEQSSHISIKTDSIEYKADQVILTTPAPITKKILQNVDSDTLPLLETPYSSSIVISLLTNINWHLPKRISSVYGFLYNPTSDCKIAAIAIENNKFISNKSNNYIINIMLSNCWAKKLLAASDDEIFSLIQLDINTIFPDIIQNIDKKFFSRWEYAMPCTPIGRANAVKKYRHSRTENNKIWLAGDYLGFPWTDSAAQTGMWAANQIFKNYSK
jgi:oxygen-dependent protoporphyrinogen oxidase